MLVTLVRPRDGKMIPELLLIKICLALLSYDLAIRVQMSLDMNALKFEKLYIYTVESSQT